MHHHSLNFVMLYEKYVMSPRYRLYHSCMDTVSISYSSDRHTMQTDTQCMQIQLIVFNNQVKLRNRNLVTCTLLSLLWYEIKDVPIYRCKSFKFRTLGVKFRYIYCS